MNRRLSLTVSSLFLAVIFAFDLFTPLGSIEWTLYLLPTIAASISLRRHDVFILAVVSTLLIICGLIFSPGGGIATNVALFNRSLGILLLWVTSYIISQRNSSEKVLRESEEKFRALVEQSIAGIAVIQDEVFVYVNPRLAELFGSEEKEMIGMSPLDFVIEADRKMVKESLKRRMSGEIASDHFLFHIKKKDGTEREAELFSRVITYKGARAFLSTLLDVTERKRAEEALHTSESRYRAIVENQAEFVVRYLHGGILTFVNDTLCRYINVPREDLLGRSYYPFVDEEDREAFIRKIEALDMNNPSMFAEARVVLPDGRIRWHQWTHHAIFDEKGSLVEYQSTGRDVTEQKRLEDELLSAQKLDSLGILAGGLAHDFNNLLMGIMGNISFAKLYIEETSKAYERLEEAEKASERARELTQQLLTFSKGGEPVREVASIEKVIREMSSFALRGSNVTCKSTIPEDIWHVNMDSGQISQVINNIVINAKQAMPAGGLLEISCENVTLDGQTALALKEGKYVKVSFADNGIGVSREYLKKIFDPYFTTKEEGRGLGLTSCYSIMKRHGGHIDVTSALGSGTTFTLYLPAAEEKPITREVRERNITIGDNRGNILLMDDEDMVLDVAGEMLRKLGYTVLSARDGREAIEMFKDAREQGEPFDAVIMDLTVPGRMGGKEAMGELLKIDPQVKAIVSSGYAHDPITADYRAYGFRAALAKPYKIRDLGAIVKEVLSK